MSDTYYLWFLYIRSYRHVSFLNFPCQQRVRYNTILIFSSISIPFAYSYHPFSPLPSASICLYLPPPSFPARGYFQPRFRCILPITQPSLPHYSSHQDNPFQGNTLSRATFSLSLLRFPCTFHSASPIKSSALFRLIKVQKKSRSHTGATLFLALPVIYNTCMIT